MSSGARGEDSFTLEVEISESDNAFINFDDGGTAKVETLDVANNQVTLRGDYPVPPIFEGDATFPAESTHRNQWRITIRIDELRGLTEHINKVNVHDH